MKKVSLKMYINILTAVFLILFISVWGLNQFGMEAYTILSGSMEPTIHTGDLVLVNTKNQEAQRDDVIAFYMGGNVVVHRVVEVTEEGTYITKGDANEAIDLDEVEKDRVIGLVWIVLRNFKWFWIFFSSKARYWAVVILLVINIFAEDFERVDGGVVVGNS